MKFKPFVELWRHCKNPAFEDGRFSGSVCDIEGFDLFRCCEEESGLPAIDLVVDGQSRFDATDLPQDTKKIEFTLQLPQGSAQTFHENFSALLEKAPSVSQGHMPAECFLAEENLYWPVDGEDCRLQALEKICKLIGELKTLAYHASLDERDPLKLVFFLPDEAQAKPKSVELVTKVTADLINGCVKTDFSLVSNLVQSDPSQNTHHHAQKGIFATTLAHFLGTQSRDSRFFYLLTHWDEFCRDYQQNLELYVSGFAFHKLQSEMARKEIEIATALSRVVSEISGKVLSIPVSLVAVIVLFNTPSFAQQLLLLLGIGLASILIGGMIQTHKRSLSRISHAKDIAFASLESNQIKYPELLKNELLTIKNSLESDRCRLGRWLKIFFVINLVPFVTGFLIVLWRQQEAFLTLL